MIDIGGLGQRRVASERVQRLLVAMTNAELVNLIQAGEALGSGIGGSRSLVLVDGVAVFVKLVPLTDLEQLPENAGSTANLFDLPMDCQYGVGGPSFSGWREVAASVMATGWVTSGACGSFPMLHHWRPLSMPAFGGPLPDELGDIDEMVLRWGGSSAVRRRAEAIAESASSLALFFEFIPQLLSDELSQLLASDQLTDAVLEATLSDLLCATAVMNSAGLMHFDTHFGNILSAAQNLYVADFGLALSSSFDLTQSEANFLDANGSHDTAYVTTRMVNWIVSSVGQLADWEPRYEAIRDIASGESAKYVVPGPGAAIVERFAGVASIVNAFYEQRHGDDRTEPYPSARIEAAFAAATTQ